MRCSPLFPLTSRSFFAFLSLSIGMKANILYFLSLQSEGRSLIPTRPVVSPPLKIKPDQNRLDIEQIFQYTIYKINTMSVQLITLD